MWSGSFDNTIYIYFTLNNEIDISRSLSDHPSPGISVPRKRICSHKVAPRHAKKTRAAAGPQTYSSKGFVSASRPSERLKGSGYVWTRPSVWPQEGDSLRIDQKEAL